MDPEIWMHCWIQKRCQSGKYNRIEKKQQHTIVHMVDICFLKIIIGTVTTVTYVRTLNLFFIPICQIK